jgi:glycosyltransferase involved in cell wall biosynthesis
VFLSVIIPVRNGSPYLHECVGTVKNLSSSNTEIIVVDDASSDDSASIAAQMGARVLRLGDNRGPGAARNYGVAQSRGDIVFFVDSDVVVAPDAIKRLADAFSNQPDVAAVFGSYDNRPRAKGVVSQYRNLLHHFVHQNGNPDASTFWGGCGAVRRSVFEAVGGFDEAFRPVCSVDDIELGYRILSAGHRILLDKALQGTHLKRWTLRSMILTDITHRAIPWSRLIIASHNAPKDLNLKISQRISALLVLLGCMLLLLSAFRLELLAFAVGALLAAGILNRDLYRFFYRQRGLLFASSCIPLHFLYYFYSSLTYLFVWATFHLKFEPPHSPGAIPKP